MVVVPSIGHIRGVKHDYHPLVFAYIESSPYNLHEPWRSHIFFCTAFFSWHALPLEFELKNTNPKYSTGYRTSDRPSHRGPQLTNGAFGPSERPTPGLFWTC